MPDLSELREEINQVDAEIITLLARRMEIAKLVREHKAGHKMAALSSDRWQELTKLHSQKCNEVGLDYKLVGPIFDLVHEYVLKNVHKGLK